MDNQEAKFLLRAYRPNGADTGDALFTDALSQAQKDPALGEWHRQEQSFDRAIAGKVKGMAVPAGLRDAILTGGKVSRKSAAWWKQPSWMGLAAAIAVLFGVGFIWVRGSSASSADRLANFAANDVLYGHHGGHGEPTQEAQASLGNPAIPLSTGLAEDFDALKRSGCRTLSFAGHDVLEICFLRNSTQIHLYVMRRSEGPAMEKPEFAEKDGLGTAMWADPKNVYVAVSHAGTAVLRNFL